MNAVRLKKNLIYLTGFMGSGKSTIAPILASTIGYSFLDIDKEIEQRTGKKVTDIFTDHGEEYFRIIERDLLEKASNEQHSVISLGGGTIANATNLTIVKNSGILVYLKVSIEQMFQRLKHKTDRPLLKDEQGIRLNESELRERIIAIFQAREPFYSQADIIIETGTNRVGITVDEIVRRITPLIE